MVRAHALAPGGTQCAERARAPTQVCREHEFTGLVRQAALKKTRMFSTPP